MFEKKKQFNWKTPILILLGVSVLSGGIFVGVKSKESQEKEAKLQEIDKSKEVSEEKEVFEISKDCEIWVHKKKEDGAQSESAPTMIGTVDKALLNMSKDEIELYLKDKYPQRQIESISKYEIVLSEIEKYNDPSKVNKYALEIENELIGLYKYDGDGNRALIEETQIHINSLPKSVQQQIKDGFVMNSEEEAYSQLENFGS